MQNGVRKDCREKGDSEKDPNRAGNIFLAFGQGQLLPKLPLALQTCRRKETFDIYCIPDLVA